MDITFERGDPQRPKGHAMLYFRVDTEPDRVYATYVVTLPIKADLTKYVPPFLSSHLGNLPLSDFSAFAMPPVPEPVDSYQELERLSRLRDDDLVYGSNMFSFDLPRMMEAVTEAVQEYSQMSSSFVGGGAAPALETAGSPEIASREPEDDRSYHVNEVLFGLMSESDKLGELTKLVGRLRFAVEGGEDGLGREAESDIALLANHLPVRHRRATAPILHWKSVENQLPWDRRACGSYRSENRKIPMLRSACAQAIAWRRSEKAPGLRDIRLVPRATVGEHPFRCSPPSPRRVPVWLHSRHRSRRRAKSSH